MAQPWQTLDAVDTSEGVLELRQRGKSDFLILINNRVLMNSSANRSELALGKLASRKVASQSRPRVLVGGLGMGLTLRAILDTLPHSARVIVAELNQVVVAWCKGPLSRLTNSAVDDSRVTITLNDVAAVIRNASLPRAKKFDAIIIDLYEGPHAASDAIDDPFYGILALKATWDALTPEGVFAVWGEAPDATFEKRLVAASFEFERQRPGRGGLRHVVYIAMKKHS